jgi:hypothetical protein
MAAVGNSFLEERNYMKHLIMITLMCGSLAMATERPSNQLNNASKLVLDSVGLNTDKIQKALDKAKQGISISFQNLQPGDISCMNQMNIEKGMFAPKVEIVYYRKGGNGPWENSTYTTLDRDTSRPKSEMDITATLVPGSGDVDLVDTAAADFDGDRHYNRIYISDLILNKVSSRDRLSILAEKKGSYIEYSLQITSKVQEHIVSQAGWCTSKELIIQIDHAEVTPDQLKDLQTK